MSNIKQENFRANDVAVYLGIGVSTVWLYAKQGKLKPIKLSARTTIFKKSDIDAFIASSNDEVA